MVGRSSSSFSSILTPPPAPPPSSELSRPFLASAQGPTSVFIPGTCYPREQLSQVVTPLSQDEPGPLARMVNRATTPCFSWEPSNCPWLVTVISHHLHHSGDPDDHIGAGLVGGGYLRDHLFWKVFQTLLGHLQAMAFSASGSREAFSYGDSLVFWRNCPHWKPKSISL